jgi:small subunit ribosomal protein S6
VHTGPPIGGDTLLPRKDRGRTSPQEVRVSVSTAPRHYELLLILDPTLDERTVAPSIDTFLNVIRQGGGTVEKVDIWGKRRLAYEIDKNPEGIYAVINVNCPAAVVSELDRQLNLNESVLRTKIARPGAK